MIISSIRSGQFFCKSTLKQINFTWNLNYTEEVILLSHSYINHANFNQEIPVSIYNIFVNCSSIFFQSFPHKKKFKRRERERERERESIIIYSIAVIERIDCIMRAQLLYNNINESFWVKAGNYDPAVNLEEILDFRLWPVEACRQSWVVHQTIVSLLLLL